MDLYHWAFCCLSAPSFSIPSHPVARPAISSALPRTPAGAGSVFLWAFAAYATSQLLFPPQKKGFRLQKTHLHGFNPLLGIFLSAIDPFLGASDVANCLFNVAFCVLSMAAYHGWLLGSLGWVGWSHCACDWWKLKLKVGLWNLTTKWVEDEGH